MFTSIPKDFLTKLYIGEGPWGGPYASICFCGRDFDEDDPVVLVRNKDGDLMCCHEECIGGIPDA